MKTTQWVPASRRDIKAGAKVRVKFNREKDDPTVYGTVTVHPVQRRGGDLHFRLDVGTEVPLLVRHGDYTHTVISVAVVPAERIRSLTTARKRSWSTPDPVRDVDLHGGPFGGGKWTCQAMHPANTLRFTVNGVTGQYRDSVWVA